MNTTARSVIAICIIILGSIGGILLVREKNAEPEPIIDQTQTPEVVANIPVPEVKGEADEPTDWITHIGKLNNYEIKYPSTGKVVACPPVFENSFCVELPIATDTNLKSKLFVVSEPNGYIDCFDPASLRGTAPGPDEKMETVTLSSGLFTHAVHKEGTAGTQYENFIYSPLHGSICTGFYFVLQTSNVPTDKGQPKEFDREAETAIFNQILVTFFPYSK